MPTSRFDRPDHAANQAVSDGIKIAAKRGRKIAAAYMARERIPLHVICRVLEGDPARRRKG